MCTSRWMSLYAGLQQPPCTEWVFGYVHACKHEHLRACGMGRKGDVESVLVGGCRSTAVRWEKKEHNQNADAFRTQTVEIKLDTVEGKRKASSRKIKLKSWKMWRLKGLSDCLPELLTSESTLDIQTHILDERNLTCDLPTTQTLVFFSFHTS